MTTPLRKRLHAGETVLGTMLTLPEPAVAEILAAVGYEWLFVDGEHGPFETPDVVAVLQAVGDRMACIVRVPGVDEGIIKKLLDQGVAGIIVPQVNTPEQAAAIVRYCRYAPVGARGVGLGRAQGYGLNFQDYIDRANDEITVVVQAEHIDAVNNIERIVEVPGIDAVLIGPYDLAASMNKMGQVDDPEVVAAIDRVTQTCKKASVPLGIFGVKPEAIQPYRDAGYTLLVAGVDTLFLAGAARDMLNAMRG